MGLVVFGASESLHAKQGDNIHGVDVGAVLSSLFVGEGAFVGFLAELVEAGLETGVWGQICKMLCQFWREVFRKLLEELLETGAVKLRAHNHQDSTGRRSWQNRWDGEG